MAKNAGALGNGARKLAKELKAAKSPVNFATDRALKANTFTKAKSRRPTDGENPARKLCCGRALEERADGVVDTGRVAFSGETWLAANRNRVNFQNDKK